MAKRSMFTCDRCSREAVVDDNKTPEGWGTINYRLFAEKQSQATKQLCKECFAGLGEWWRLVSQKGPGKLAND